MASDPGNIHADPKLAATDRTSFDHQSGSPALNAGTYLTTVAAGDSGSGTSLVVNDAASFQDGVGITAPKADCISVTTVTNHVCITAVNYQTKTLTLANSIARSVGDPVCLYSDSTGRTVLIGSAPYRSGLRSTFIFRSGTADGPLPRDRVRASQSLIPAMESPSFSPEA